MLKLVAPLVAGIMLVTAAPATAASFVLGPIEGVAGAAVSTSAGGFFMGGQTKLFYRLQNPMITDLTITGATPGAGIKIYGFKSTPIGYADSSGAFTLPGPLAIFYTHDNDYGRITLYGPYFLGNITLEGTAYGHIPEPATWALMISGFGLTGLALRRRRLVPA